MLTLMLVFYGFSSTFFTHTHFNHSTPVTHSHPFSPLGGQNPTAHNHSENDMLLSILFSLAMSAVILGIILKISESQKLKSFIIDTINYYNNNSLFASNQLRAPPCLTY